MFKEIIARLLNQAPRNSYNEISVKFYKDCIDDIPHGELVVSSKRRGLDHVAIPFVFSGATTPPVLTARLMQDIESAAKSQGYVPHYLLPETYGRIEVEQPDGLEQFPEGTPQRTEMMAAHIGQTTYLDRKLAERREQRVPAAQRAPRATEMIDGYRTFVLEDHPRDLATGELLEGSEAAAVFAVAEKRQAAEQLIKRWMVQDQRRNGIYAMLGVDLKPKVWAGLMAAASDALANMQLESSQFTHMQVKFDEVTAALWYQGRQAQTSLRKLTLDEARKTVAGKHEVDLDGYIGGFLTDNIPEEAWEVLGPVWQDELRAILLMEAHNSLNRSCTMTTVKQNLEVASNAFCAQRVGKVELQFSRQPSAAGTNTMQ